MYYNLLKIFNTFQSYLILSHNILISQNSQNNILKCQLIFKIPVKLNEIQ